MLSGGLSGEWLGSVPSLGGDASCVLGEAGDPSSGRIETEGSRPIETRSIGNPLALAGGVGAASATTECWVGEPAKACMALRAAETIASGVPRK